MSSADTKRILSWSSAPIFFAFFVWGFGTGAQHLARPLFAGELTGGNAFLVAFVIAMNAVPRLFTGPMTGYLTDKLGRRPLAIFGAALRGVTNVGQFMAGDFVTFLILEFVGQIGVSMWNTSSNVLLSDMTQTSNRGRALAARQMSMRAGFVVGPLVAGIVAQVVNLESVFLINGASKVVIVLVVLLLVKETLQRTVRSTKPGDPPQEQKETARAAVVRAMRTRSFVALALAVIGFSMTQTALLQALLPFYMSDVLEVGEGGVGGLVSLAAFLAALIAMPNGMISDRYGRKVSMVPGLALLAVAATVLTVSQTYLLVMIAVAIQGSGEGMTMGTWQTYAMDIAPPDHRGSFLGVVMMFQAVGAFAGPMMVGALYHFVSHEVAFATLAVWLAAASVSMLLLARETAGPRARQTERSAGGA